MQDVIGRVRDFNRYYTQRIGVLTDRYLGQRPLGEARLLFELGRTGDVAAVRSRLGLDSGYLSRLLRSLERQELVTLGAHPADARARIATLTRAGLEALSELDDQSEAAAASLIAPLGAEQRDQLAAAMDTVQRLLRLAAVAIEEVPAESAGATRCLDAYAAELAVRFPEGYGPQDLCPREQLNSPTGIFLVAADGQGEAGCVGLRTLRPGVGEIRHLWVHQRMRRCGLGQRMLHELETRAAKLGLRSLWLGIHRSLPEAIAMYQRLGYREIAPYSDDAHNQCCFAKDLAPSDNAVRRNDAA